MNATRLFAGSIALFTLVGLAACGGQSDGNSAADGPTAAESPVAAASTAPASTNSAGPDSASTDPAGTEMADGAPSAAATAVGQPGAKPGKPVRKPVRTSPSSKPASGATWLSAYLGTWSGHGRQIVINTDGFGTMDGRTYVTCGTNDVKTHPGVPCEANGPEPVSKQLVRVVKSARTGLVRLEIIQSNDARQPVGFYGTKLSHGEKVLTIAFTGPNNVAYCAADIDDATSRDVCGA